ncbi:family 43 glycosylhydrolase [Neolewinella sp.]|uniref:family 43 glycosylhydrolase n=1 Tax=Neolewinella sp. TaxID=2993543 RepID=UPI003B526AD3
MRRLALSHYVLLSVLFVGFRQHQTTFTGNPILPHYESADPQIAFVNNRYYLYPTDNTRPDPGFSVWSSDDLKDWRNEGNILSLSTVPFASGRPWAPGFAQRNGRYYFYFSADDRIGVAVSDTPTGEYKEVLGKPLVTYEADLSTIDPMAFIDDDGKAYLYWGAVPGLFRRDSADVIINSLMVRELNDDMVTPEGPTIYTVRALDEHIEGTYVFKRHGTYYLMYSAGNFNAPADSPHAYRVEYATADSPLGPFNRAANNPVLASNVGDSIVGPGHNSILHIPGTDEWYIVYHAHRGGAEVRRQVFINRMEFDADGLITPITPDRRGVAIRPIQLGLTLDDPGPLRVGDTLSMRATCQWPADELQEIVFYANGESIAVVSKPPYAYAWADVPTGFHRLFAEAKHRSGATTTSSAWNVDVRALHPK